MAAPRKEGDILQASNCTDWKAKVERFLPARLAVTGIRQITKRNAHCQFCAAAFETEWIQIIATLPSYACNNRLPAAAREFTRGQGNNCGSEF